MQKPKTKPKQKKHSEFVEKPKKNPKTKKKEKKIFFANLHFYKKIFFFCFCRFVCSFFFVFYFKFHSSTSHFLVAVESSLEEDVHLATTYLEAGAPQEINVLQTTKVDLLVHLEKACQLKRAIKEDVLTLFMQNYTVFRNA